MGGGNGLSKQRRVFLRSVVVNGRKERGQKLEAENQNVLPTLSLGEGSETTPYCPPRVFYYLQ